MNAVPKQKVYYVSNGSAQSKPLSQSQVEDLLQRGEVTKDSLAIAEGMSDWVPLARFAEFTSSVPFTPPPLPGSANTSAFQPHASPPQHAMDADTPMGARVIFKKLFGIGVVGKIFIAVVFTSVTLNFVVPFFKGTQDNEKIKIASSRMKVILEASQLYRLHVGSYPEEVSDLVMNDKEKRAWRGPYIKGDVVEDPWSNVFETITENGNFTVSSSGPDGKVGTPDDLVYP